jgi:hypothetical protein
VWPWKRFTPCPECEFPYVQREDIYCPHCGEDLTNFVHPVSNSKKYLWLIIFVCTTFYYSLRDYFFVVPQSPFIYFFIVAFVFFLILFAIGILPALLLAWRKKKKKRPWNWYDTLNLSVYFMWIMTGFFFLFSRESPRSFFPLIGLLGIFFAFSYYRGLSIWNWKQLTPSLKRELPEIQEKDDSCPHYEAKLPKPSRIEESEMLLNRNQKYALLAGLAGLLVIFLFPPWHINFRANNFLGFAFILSKPQNVAAIYIPMLLAELAGLVVATTGIVFYLSSGRS